MISTLLIYTYDKTQHAQPHSAGSPLALLFAVGILVALVGGLAAWWLMMDRREYAPKPKAALAPVDPAEKDGVIAAQPAFDHYAVPWPPRS